MPSAKPDKQEVDELRKRRRLWERDSSLDLYAAVHQECVRAVDGGFTTLERARSLLAFLQRETAVSSVYPNNALAQILTGLCTEGAWTAEAEGELLHCLYSLYVGYETGGAPRRNIGIAILFDAGTGNVTTSELATETFRPPSYLDFFLGEPRVRESPRLRSLFTLIFDDAPPDLDMAERFVAFTGPFTFGTRAACFAAARKLGGVPCDRTANLDMLFVSRSHEEQKAISGQLSSAINCRRLQALPKIYRETDWQAVLERG